MAAATEIKSLLTVVDLLVQDPVLILQGDVGLIMEIGLARLHKETARTFRIGPQTQDKRIIKEDAIHLRPQDQEIAASPPNASFLLARRAKAQPQTAVGEEGLQTLPLAPAL